MASLLRKAAKALVTIVEDRLESWGDPAGRDMLLKALREERERAARIVERNRQLEDDWHRVQDQMDELLDKFAFNGPSLYRDEVEALKFAEGLLDRDYAPEWIPMRDAIRSLLSRSDKMPMTEKELAVTVHGIVTGQTTTLPWDAGSDDDPARIFDPEMVPTDDEEFNG